MGASFVQIQPTYSTILQSDIPYLIWLNSSFTRSAKGKALPRMQLFAKIRLGDKNIIFGGLEDVGKKLVLGSYEVCLVGMDGVCGLGLPLPRLGTVRIQKAVLPNTAGNKIF
jgi:hypothetical protein